jgi:hypothetical protein
VSREGCVAGPSACARIVALLDRNIGFRSSDYKESMMQFAQ